MSVAPASVVRFRSFQLDVRSGELRRNGIKIRVPDQSIQVLTMLLEHSGEVVTREELYQRLWPDGTIVEFEHGINSIINRLRQALEDSADEPRFIETLPRRGYRFLVPVEKSTTAPQDPSIAVLPFTNLSADKENDYFSDGLAEEILNALSQVEDLRVAARTSSFSFKGKAVEISEIGAKLNVANVLEGSARRAGNRVRVTVQLVDVRNGFHLWSERYDRQMEDLFDLQDEIARAITERLKVSLSGGVKRSTENPEAYELYLKGRHYWHQRSPATVRLATQCFEEAIKLDPRYALAYAGLADCYGILRAFGWLPPKDAGPPAHAAVTQAMALAPSLWEVNFSRGFYACYFECAWRDAEPYFQKAILINPRSSLARAYYGLFLATDGRAEEAVAQTTVACQADALSPFIHGLTSLALYALARFDEAERMAHHVLELQPGYLLGLYAHGMALCGLGRNEEAIECLERAVTASRAPNFVGLLGLAYARGGRLDDATRLLHELEDRSSRGEYVPTIALLHINVGQGDLPAIRGALSKALAEGTPPFVFRPTSGPFLEAYRSDPEVNRLLLELYGR
jgi:TolB-like protein/Tfp pilus assembly protein PilF